jgi:hypothetical protein
MNTSLAQLVRAVMARYFVDNYYFKIFIFQFKKISLQINLIFQHITQLFYTQICFISKNLVVEEINL